MARLIPSFVDDCTPDGERQVFSFLANGPDNWVILHSLDLAPWNNRLRTEIDFVVIVPDSGILCIEVKSHDDIRFDGSRWWPNSIKRSPFKQAADGRFALLRGLSDCFPDFKEKKVPIVHLCIFPNSQFDLGDKVLSVNKHELIDIKSFGQYENGTDFCLEIKKRICEALKAEKLNPPSPPLSKAWIDKLVETCVPIQKRRPDALNEIRQRELKLQQLLREQQKQVLMFAEVNECLIVSGGAGTGKTLIAMEVAKRKAESGLRVGLFFFNQLVGDHVKKLMEEATVPLPNLLVGRVTQIMAQLAGIKVPPNSTQTYWDIEFPEKLEERLTDPKFSEVAAFDYVVLDEAQDILARPSHYEYLFRFLKGGFEEGRFAFFGDFDNQVIAERDIMQKNLQSLKSYAHPANCHLSENCRNYKIVGEMAVTLSGIKKRVYNGYLRGGGETRNYDICYYGNVRAQLDQIKIWLSEFRSQGFKPWEITLLSFCSEEASAAIQLKNEACRLDPAWMESQNTGYATVHSFKGMENKVIILTDVDMSGRQIERSLFYTGMTRATESVRVLCSESSKNILISYFQNL